MYNVYIILSVADQDQLLNPFFPALLLGKGDNEDLPLHHSAVHDWARTYIKKTRRISHGL
jgi:hypothetical protein